MRSHVPAPSLKASSCLSICSTVLIHPFVASDTGGETIHTEQRAKGSASTPSLLCLCHLVTEAQSYEQSHRLVLLFLAERCCTPSFQVIHLVVCWDCALGTLLLKL